MSQATECLNLARREVELFSDEWINARENECQELGMLIRKALYTHDHLVKTDEFYRSLMGESKCGYDHVVDIKLLSLMVAWMDVSNEIHAQAADLNFYGFDVDHSDRFGRQLENISWILNPSFPGEASSDWDKLLLMSREGFQHKRYDEAHGEWWASAPTTRPLEFLRQKNMRAAGIVGDEFREFVDLEKFPGTLLSELREFIVIKEALATAEAIR